ncbi:hypothetical protein THARTR1_05207 [Trichoderma harzianum]|uniref:Uncharacterized protein n=1 Tax=Trichoderma harzianum TaxID=5544 RepID=A0A2K0UA35_TRIHA|nr:hypothetical protein THARTR1_05207 [Trichoderma harzianum]
MSGSPPMENSNVDDRMAPGQDFNMDDYIFHSGGDPNYFYLDEEPNFTTVSQEGPLDPHFNFTEYLASAIMPQEEPLGPFFNFDQEPIPSVTSQESFTPPVDYGSFWRGSWGWMSTSLLT